MLPDLKAKTSSLQSSPRVQVAGHLLVVACRKSSTRLVQWQAIESKSAAHAQHVLAEVDAQFDKPVLEMDLTELESSVQAKPGHPNC